MGRRDLEALDILALLCCRIYCSVRVPMENRSSLSGSLVAAANARQVEFALKSVAQERLPEVLACHLLERFGKMRGLLLAEEILRILNQKQT